MGSIEYKIEWNEMSVKNKSLSVCWNWQINNFYFQHVVPLPIRLLLLLLSLLLLPLQVYPLSLRYRYYSPYSDYLEAESALRRSRLAAEVAASRIATEDAIRRSRIAAELAASRVATESALRRSRLEAELAASRVASEVALRDSLRRLRIDAEVDSILRRY